MREAEGLPNVVLHGGARERVEIAPSRLKPMHSLPGKHPYVSCVAQAAVLCVLCGVLCGGVGVS